MLTYIMLSLDFANIVKHSGLWAMIVGWLMIVLPFYVSKGKRRWTFFSQAAVPGFWGTIFDIGMILSCTLQFAFAFFLSTHFKSGFPAFGVKMYFVSLIGFLMAGIITHYKNYRLHVFFMGFYYFLMSYAFIIIGFGMGAVTKLLSLLLLVVPSIVLIDKRNGVLFELWLMSLAGLLVLSIYFHLGIFSLV